MKIIAVCVVILTVFVVGGGLMGFNNYYDWTGRISEWSRLRQQRSENESFYSRRIAEASKLTGPAEIKFLEYACRGTDMGEYNGFTALCVLDVSKRVHDLGCKKAFADNTLVWERFDEARRNGDVNFACD